MEAEPKARAATPWKPFYMLMDFIFFGVPYPYPEFHCFRFSAALNQANGVKKRDKTDGKRGGGAAGGRAIAADPTENRIDLDGELHAMRRSDRLNEKPLRQDAMERPRCSEKNGEMGSTC